MTAKIISKKHFGIILLSAVAFAAPACIKIREWKKTHTPPDDACVHCHYAIYKDWKISYRPYNEAAKKEDYEPVHSMPMSAADVRKERAHREGKGECSECHVIREPEAKLEISKIGASFADTIYQLCGRCHETTFNEWKGSGFYRIDISCLVCHADVRDKPVGEEKGYYHTIEGIKGFDPETFKPSLMKERIKEAVDVSVDYWIEKDTVHIIMIVTNRGVGHNLPTDAIDAAVLANLNLVDKDGVVITSKKSIIGGWGKNPIPSGGSSYLEYDLEVPFAGDYSLEVTIDHADRELKGEKVMTMYSKRFDLTVEGDKK